MDIKELVELAKQALSELQRHKVAAVLGAVALAFVIFFVGVQLPQSYSSSALIQADRKEALEPLLAGRTNTSRLKEIPPNTILIETIYSPLILRKTALKLGMISGASSDAQIYSAENLLANRLSHKPVDNKLVRIFFTSDDPKYSRDALEALIDVFMENASKQRLTESTEAYDFISAQAEEYARQLADAEAKLSDFKINNLDGTEAEAFDRVNELKVDIQELTFSVDDNTARAAKLREQIAKEGFIQQARTDQNILLGQLREAELKLQTLQLSFQDDYPDIVTAKSQIAQINAELAQLRSEFPNLPTEGSGDERSLFEELRSTLSALEQDTESKLRRKQSLQALLNEETSRVSKIAVDQAKLSALTRDYDKTQQIYEEMLQKRETAKLSLTIDEEGKGMTYKVSEPPSMPLSSQGLPPSLFIAAGPLIAGLAPLGLCLAFVILDPRVRYGITSNLKLPEGLDIVVSIPSYHNESTPILKSWSNIALAIFVIAAGAAYVWLAYIWLQSN